MHASGVWIDAVRLAESEVLHSFVRIENDPDACPSIMRSFDVTIDFDSSFTTGKDVQLETTNNHDYTNMTKIFVTGATGKSSSCSYHADRTETDDNPRLYRRRCLVRHCHCASRV